MFGCPSFYAQPHRADPPIFAADPRQYPVDRLAYKFTPVYTGQQDAEVEIWLGLEDGWVDRHSCGPVICYFREKQEHLLGSLTWRNDGSRADYKLAKEPVSTPPPRSYVELQR